MKHLLFFMLLLLAVKSNAQKNSSKGAILEINPFDSGFIKTRLPYGSTVKFKITNVNPFKIDGTNSITKESISFDVPAQFSKLLASDDNNGSSGKDNFSTTDLKHIESQLDGASRHGLVQDNFPDRSGHSQNNNLAVITDFKKIFINNYKGFVSTLNKLSLYTSVDAYIDSLLRDTFIIDTTTLKSNLDGYMKSINDDNADINLLRGKCKSALEDLDKYYINAKGAYDALAGKINNEKVILDGQLKSKDGTVTLNVDGASAILNKEKIFEKEYNFLTAKYDTINAGSKRTAIVSKTNAGIDYYNRVHNAKFEVYTDAQQLNDDKITITPKLKNAKGDIVKEYNPIEIKTYGGWKIDFSSGYLLSFRGDENYTNLYDSSGIAGVQKNKTDNLKHAIGALLNAYPRTGRDVNVGISFGISIPTDGTGVGFYGGISALLLEKNRLVLSFGLAENKVKLLNTANLTKDLISEKTSGKETYKFSSDSFKEINYDNVYRPAFFIGISYNIFNVKKQ